MSLGMLKSLQKGRVSWLAVSPEQIEVEIDQCLADAKQLANGRPVAWLPEDGGLISNLKAWENIILLPGLVEATPQTHEARLQTLCQLLPSPAREWPVLLELPVARLDATERRVVGALRCLIAAPEIWMVDGRIFADAIFLRFWRGLVQFTAEVKVMVIGADQPLGMDWFTVDKQENVENEAPQ